MPRARPRPAHATARTFSWTFPDAADAAAPSGVFHAQGLSAADRLYVPLANDAGALSWTSPCLHGGLALSHHEYLSPPLTAEDLSHSLLRRECWMVEAGRSPFALSGLGATARRPGVERATVDAGPGWFQLTRRDATGRFSVSATLWCPAEAPDALEVFLITVTNHSRRPLRLTPYAAIPLFCRSADNVRDHRHVTALLHRIRLVPHGVVVEPTMAFDERGHRPNTTQYAVLASGPAGVAPAERWALEEDFLGPGGTWAAPAAVWEGRPAPRRRGAALAGREAVAAFRFAAVRLAPGASAAYTIVSGIAPRRGDARVRRWARWIRRPHAVARSLARTQQTWQRRARRIVFTTGDRTLDQWLTWVGIQPILRRLFGNSYLPQFDYGRGGRGWRDLWQDCLALLLHDPAAVRPMLLHHLGGVRIDGSNATIIARGGEFIADRNNIPRTWMDHGVWPVFTTLLYVEQTGDWRFLLAPRAYFRDPQLFRGRVRDDRWTARDGQVLRTRGGRTYRGSVFQHLLVQTLTASFNVGEHNLCRLEGADWNDGLDMAAERGESAAFSACYAWNLARLADTADALAAHGVRTLRVPRELLLLLDRLPGQRPIAYGSAPAKRARLHAYLTRVARDLSGREVGVPLTALARDLRAKHADLAQRVRTREWVAGRGARWFNGYYDNHGRRVEGAAGARVRMTLTGQVFPVMAGIATEAQVGEVRRAVHRFLRDPRTGGIRLNTDFGGPQPSLGRAFAFAYGDKENGAVFSHMAVLYASALYQRRRPGEGREVWHALYRMATDARARIFPGLPEYFNREGRGLYAYLTGSASWLMLLLLTQVYGLRGEAGDLVLDPQLMPEDFDRRGSAGVELTFAGRRLAVTFTNPPRLPPGRCRVAAVRLNGRAVLTVPRAAGGVIVRRRTITSLARGRTHRVEVQLHAAR